MDKYELFYGSGGHGGPYHGFLSAVEAAKRLILGRCGESDIFIKLRTVEGYLSTAIVHKYCDGTVEVRA